MSQHNKSRWFRKSRLNVESGLNENLGQWAHNSINESIINTRDSWTIMWFQHEYLGDDGNVNKNFFQFIKDVTTGNSDGIGISVKGRNLRIVVQSAGSSVFDWTSIIFMERTETYFYAVTHEFDGADSIFRVYRNAKLFASNTFSTSPALPLTSNSYKTFDDSRDKTQSHAIFLNKTLTEAEQHYTYINGGIVRPDLHEFVVSHFPLTQNYIGKKKIGTNITGSVTGDWAYFNEVIAASTDGYCEMQLPTPISGDQLFIGFSYTAVQTNINLLHGLRVRRISRDSIYQLNNGSSAEHNFDEQELVLKIERVGTTCNVYLSGLLKYSFTIVDTNPLYLCINYNALVSSSLTLKGVTIDGAAATLDAVNSGASVTSSDGERRHVWDVVEQYNYAKTTPITANHGACVGYTDDEVGAVNPSSQTAFKDFYEKDKPNFYGFDFEGKNGSFEIPHAAALNIWTTNNKFSICLEIITGSDIFTTQTISAKIRDSNPVYGFDLKVQNQSFRLEWWEGAGGGFGRFYEAFSSTIQTNTKYLVVVFVDIVDASKTYFIVNSVQRFSGLSGDYSNTTVTVTNELSIGQRSQYSDRPLLANLFSVSYFNDELPASEILNFMRKKDYRGHYNLSSFVEAYHLDPTNGGQLHSITGSNDSTVINGLTTADLTIGSPFNLEKASIFPPRIKALTFNGTNQYLRVPDLHPSKELGYSCLFAVALDSDRTYAASFKDMFLSFRNDTENIRTKVFGDPGTKRWGSEGADDRWAIGMTDVEPSKLNNLNVYSFYTINGVNQGGILPRMRKYWNGNFIRGNSNGGVVIDDLSAYTGDFFIGVDISNIGTRHLQGYMAYFAFFKGILSQKEMLEACNNTLLKNPSIQLQRKYSFELFIDFNNPFDDAGTLKFPDLSPNAHDVIAEGYTDLTDLENNLVDIDSLR